jgi:hypothetical protein
MARWGMLAVAFAVAGCGRVQLIHSEPRNEAGMPGRTGSQSTSGPIAVPTVTGFDICEAHGNSYDRINIDPEGRAGMVRVKSSSGYEVCRAWDSNRNGRFETWQVLNDARPVRIAQSSTDNAVFDQYAVFPDPLRLDCPVVFRIVGTREEVKSDACGLLSRPRVFDISKGEPWVSEP